MVNRSFNYLNEGRWGRGKDTQTSTVKYLSIMIKRGGHEQTWQKHCNFDDSVANEKAQFIFCVWQSFINSMIE